jgi:hypothetical protein
LKIRVKVVTRAPLQPKLQEAVQFGLQGATWKHVEQFGLTVLQPLRPRQTLALGAVAITAGKWAIQ